MTKKRQPSFDRHKTPRNCINSLGFYVYVLQKDIFDIFANEFELLRNR